VKLTKKMMTTTMMTMMMKVKCLLIKIALMKMMMTTVLELSVAVGVVEDTVETVHTNTAVNSGVPERERNETE
jgi:hypothetical protein